MKICKVDYRGRVQLKKLIKDLPEFYTFEVNENNEILLRPLTTENTNKDERNNEINHSI